MIKIINDFCLIQILIDIVNYINFPCEICFCSRISNSAQVLLEPIFVCGFSFIVSKFIPLFRKEPRIRNYIFIFFKIFKIWKL